MPSGNSLRVAFSILGATFGFIKPVVRLVTKVSKSIPSIKSIGSNTFPLDLLIFCPIMRATQKKMMSKPVTNTLVGWKVASSSVSSGQPKVPKVQRAEENQVSSTSSSCFKLTSALRLLSARTSSSLRPT